MQAAAQHDGIGHGQGAAVGGHGRLAALQAIIHQRCRNPARDGCRRAWRPPPRTARCPARPGSARHGAGPRAGWPAGPPRLAGTPAGRRWKTAPTTARSARFTCAATIGSFILAQGLRFSSGMSWRIMRTPVLRRALFSHVLVLELNTTEPVAPSAPDRPSTPTPAARAARSSGSPIRLGGRAPPRRRTPADADPAPARWPAALAAAHPAPDARRPR